MIDRSREDGDGVGPMIMTVAGKVPASSIGFTLPHEHLYTRFWEIDGRFDSPHLIEDDEVIADELQAFMNQGGNCLVEVTPPDIGRRPDRLLAMSKRLNLNIVMGCGWYRRLYYLSDEGLDRKPVQALTDELMQEIETGIGPDAIRPGVIGEIGCEKSWVAPVEERAHRAAARAQRNSGLPLVTHSRLSEVALDQLTIFEDEGADVTHIAVGHCDSYPYLSYYLKVLERGALLMFDNIGTSIALGRAPIGKHHARIADLLVELIDRGFVDRILLSHDICESFQLQYYGGHGFAFLQDQFMPMLAEKGVTNDLCRTITHDNPRNWLTIR